MSVMLPLRIQALCALACVSAAGCATQVQEERVAPGPETEPPARHAAGAEDEARPAAAVVFTPPLVRQEQPLDLSRSGRATEAFVGYEQGVVEHYYVRTDNRQRSGDGWNRGWGWGWGTGAHGDRYERRAVTERMGVRYR